jgi:hypothetical protein
LASYYSKISRISPVPLNEVIFHTSYSNRNSNLANARGEVIKENDFSIFIMLIVYFSVWAIGVLYDKFNGTELQSTKGARDFNME